MSKERLSKFITEYSVKNKNDFPYPVYSVTNSAGFCTGYFDKDVSGNDKRTYKIVPRGCFAYNPSRINVGSVDWQHYEDNVIVSPLYVVFKCSEDLYQPYLLYFLKSNLGKHLIASSVSGSVRFNLKLKTLGNFILNIPSVLDQKKMVEYLDAIKKAILLAEKELNVLDELIKSRFIEMFGNCDNRVRLEELSTLITKGASPKWQGINYAEKGVLFVTSENVREGFIDVSNPKYLEEKVNVKQPRSILKRGDILINIVGASIGRAAIFDYDTSANINQAVALVRPNENVNSKYLITFLNSDNAMAQYRDNAKGGARDNLSLKNISDLIIPSPNLSKQNEFDEFVEQVDKSRFIIQKRISLLTELLNKKMEEYFGG